MGAPPDVEHLGRFEIVRKLASGGMGTVSLACLSGEAGFRRFVAIKRLHLHLAEEPEFVDMFFDEARLAARIHHPNVVPILEIGKEGNERFLVMEYVEGATLEQLALKRGAVIPPAVGIRILLDALAGLHAAHNIEDDAGRPMELVHRDVSPQNILVGLDGLARLTDFGIARARSRVAKATLQGQFKGKLTYSAPEQVLGRRMDRRTDVYAMGIVLWETLTASRLFDADAEAEVWKKLLHMPVTPPEQIRPEVPREISEVVMRALEREPELRYASAADFADALEAAARTAHLHASHREVAAFVTARSGDRLNERREKVREWLSARDVTLAGGSTPADDAAGLRSATPNPYQAAGPAAGPTPGRAPGAAPRAPTTPPGLGLPPAPGTPAAAAAITPRARSSAGDRSRAGPPAGDRSRAGPSAGDTSRAGPSAGDTSRAGPSAGDVPRIVATDLGHGALPYHWSVHGGARPASVPPKRRGWPWAVGTAIVAALAGAAAIPFVRHMSARPARAPAVAAEAPAPRVEVPVPSATPVTSPTGIASGAPSAAPSASTARPRATMPGRPAATGKNAESGDRW
jgi:serine/threonine-protein kinase